MSCFEGVSNRCALSLSSPPVLKAGAFTSSLLPTGLALVVDDSCSDTRGVPESPSCRVPRHSRRTSRPWPSFPCFWPCSPYFRPSTLPPASPSLLLVLLPSSPALVPSPGPHALAAWLGSLVLHFVAVLHRGTEGLPPSARQRHSDIDRALTSLL